MARFNASLLGIIAEVVRNGLPMRIEKRLMMGVLHHKHAFSADVTITYICLFG